MPFAYPSESMALSKSMASSENRVSMEKNRQKDSTLEAFLALTANADRAFLAMEERRRFLPVCCAMANGAGGWVILGAFQEDDGQDGEFRKDLPLLVEGVPDTALLERELSFALEDAGQISANPVSFFRPLSSGDKKVLIARVEAADWFLRPLCVGADHLRGAYRRVRGVNVVSGHDTRLRMALDALEVTRDDLAVPGLCVWDLDAESVASFRAAVTTRFPRWSELSQVEFLRRALVLTPMNPLENPSGEEAGVTRAGQLLLGKGDVRVRMTRQVSGTETWEARNLWSACTDLLPRLAECASKPCEDALRECFMNALLHAEHDEGCVEIQLRDAQAVFFNPGLPRTQTSGESAARNGRLLRMFKRVGLARGQGRGLEIIRAFDETFCLQWNMLELSTYGELPLQFQEPDVPLGVPVVQVPQKKAPLPDVVPLPLAPIEKAVPPGLILAALPSDQLDPPHEIEFLEPEEDAQEEEDEYVTSQGDESELSPLVRTVRDARPSPSVVREAILELCGEYRSLPALASTLARSEGSLRRHYVTAMVREGLLEMEFPDRVGHPEQRYKTRNVRNIRNFS